MISNNNYDSIYSKARLHDTSAYSSNRKTYCNSNNIICNILFVAQYNFIEI